MFLKQRNIVFECNIFTIWNTACDASFLKHHTPVIHFDILHFKNEETLFYSVGPISGYSPLQVPHNLHKRSNRLISIFQLTGLPASGGIRPKALQLSAIIKLTGNANLLVQSQMKVKGPNLVQLRLISYKSKIETFMFVAEFQYACWHTHSIVTF